jgi:maltose alpha-D-glucosyltransferase / alpha-amylase
VPTNAPDVLVMRYEWQGHALLILHNFGGKPRAVRIDGSAAPTPTLVDLLWTNDSRADRHGTHLVELQPYDYRWFRAEGTDRNVPRP